MFRLLVKVVSLYTVPYKFRAWAQTVLECQKACVDLALTSDAHASTDTDGWLQTIIAYSNLNVFVDMYGKLIYIH